MLEIITLMMLVTVLTRMAQRRGRSPVLFAILLLVLWFGGEIAGAIIGYDLFKPQRGERNFLLIYGTAILGAVLGGLCALGIAKLIPPVDGTLREVPVTPIQRSRLLGALLGGAVGAILGGGVVYLLYGNPQMEGNLSMIVQGALAAGAIGALLGMVSGLQR